MLHRDKQSSSGSGLSSVDLPTPAELLDLFVHFFRQQYRTIFLTLLIALALCVAYLMVARPSYTAVATMLIERHKGAVFQQQMPVNSDALLDSASVESQVIVLNSDNIALSVIKKLRLNEDPEFIGSQLPSFVHRAYQAVVGLTHGDLKALLSLKPTAEAPVIDNSPSAEFIATRNALNTFKSRVAVRRDAVSFIIEIGFRSYDPEKAAAIANGIVDAYITDQLDARYQAAVRTTDWLEGRLRDLRAQATAAEQAVVDYRRQHNIVDAAGRSTDAQRVTTDTQRVTELNSQLIIARTQMAEARARLDRVQAVLNSDSSGAADGTVTDALKNDVITRLRGQYLDLSRKEADWSARYGQGHLAVANLRSQMAETRAAILDELRRLAETYKSDVEIAAQREVAAQKEYEQAVARAELNNQAQVILSDLDSKSKTYRALYENFLQRYMDSIQQQSFPIPEARLVSPAARPLKKSDPKTLVSLAIAACAGILVGFGIGVFRDLWDRTFRTTEQVEQVTRVSCIALVPVVSNQLPASPRALAKIPANVPSESKSAPKNAEEPKKDDANPQEPAAAAPAVPEQPARVFPHDEKVFWRSVDSPFTRFAEAIRAIKVAVDLTKGSRSSEVLGFTSSLPNEGKSTLAASLALSIAQAGGRVILLDCDLRNPSLTRSLAPSAKVGLLDVLAHDTPLEDALWWSELPVKLPFLPATMTSDLPHTSEILASMPMKELFDELRKKYTYVIADFSPLVPVVDVRTTAHFVDSYICVIEWGTTKIDVVKKALAEAPVVYENLLGTVLNKADISKLHRYEAHRGAYYRNEHYSRYGFS